MTSPLPPTSTTPPTNPYHITRAYGQVQQPTAIRPQRAQDQAVISPASFRPVDSGNTTEIKPSVRQERIDQLVAAQVPGKASVDNAASLTSRTAEVQALRSSPDALPMYRRPTDRNEVHTVLLVGRTLDTQG